MVAARCLVLTGTVQERLQSLRLPARREHKSVTRRDRKRVRLGCAILMGPGAVASLKTRIMNRATPNALPYGRASKRRTLRIYIGEMAIDLGRIFITGIGPFRNQIRFVERNDIRA